MITTHVDALPLGVRETTPAVPSNTSPKTTCERPLPEPEYIPGFNPRTGTFD